MSTQTTFPTGMTPIVSVFTMGSTLDTIEVTGTAAGEGIIVTDGEGRPASPEQPFFPRSRDHEFSREWR